MAKQREVHEGIVSRQNHLLITGMVGNRKKREKRLKRVPRRVMSNDQKIAKKRELMKEQEALNAQNVVEALKNC